MEKLPWMLACGILERLLVGHFLNFYFFPAIHFLLKISHTPQVAQTCSDHALKPVALAGELTGKALDGTCVLFSHERLSVLTFSAQLAGTWEEYPIST